MLTAAIAPCANSAVVTVSLAPCYSCFHRHPCVSDTVFCSVYTMAIRTPYVWVWCGYSVIMQS
jgi:hypothetical protein